MRQLSIICLSALAMGSLIGGQTVLADETGTSPAGVCKCIPATAAVEAGFDLAGIGRLGPTYPSLPRIGVDSAIVPPALLKAVGWVESNWRQFNTDNRPLISPDFGYGIMQITSGMAGAAGDPNGTGTLPLTTQDHIGGDYLFNIAYGARMLAQAFNAMPAINDRDPAILEDWYYALWAYNGWGWVNNPNNPAFDRVGTPATNPSAFPYQERVYYWLAHPPQDAEGHQLWTPMQVTLPPASKVGDTPGPVHFGPVHPEIPHVFGATYQVPSGLAAMKAGSSVRVPVHVYNTSGIPWNQGSVSAKFSLMYHWVEFGHKSNALYDPQLHGIDILDGGNVPIGATVPVGGSALVMVKLAAPTRVGKYVLEWDLWGRRHGLFSHVSVPPGLQNVRVAPPGDTISTYKTPTVPPALQGPHAWFVTYTTPTASGTVTSGQDFSETALFFNPGSTRWGPHYHLQLVCGPKGHGRDTGCPAPSGITSQIELPVFAVKACRTVPLTLTGKAPKAPGRYALSWRMEAPDGVLFGPRLTVNFTVVASSAGTTTSPGFVNRLI